MASYTITAPLLISNESPDTEIDFQSETNAKNQIVNFVASNPGDLLYRNSQYPTATNSIAALPVGTTGDYLITETVAQVEDVSGWLATPASYSGGYILFQGGATGYYVWFQTGGDSDPGIAGRTSITADITGLSTVPSIIQTTRNAINGTATGVSASSTTSTLTITQAAAGAREPASAVSLAFLSFSVTAVGSEARPGWSNFATAVDTQVNTRIGAANGLAGLDASALVPVVNIPPSVYTSTSETFLARGTTVAAAIAQTSSVILTSSNAATWSTSTDYAHDAGGLFTAGTGAFTVPAGGAGIWAVYGSVAWTANANGRRELEFLFGPSTAVNTSAWTAVNGAVTSTAIGPVNFNLAAGQIIRLRVRQTSNGTLTIAVAQFSATKIA